MTEQSASAAEPADHIPDDGKPSGGKEPTAWLIGTVEPLDPYLPEVRFNYVAQDGDERVKVGDYVILVDSTQGESHITGIGRFGGLELNDPGTWVAALDEYHWLDEPQPLATIVDEPPEVDGTNASTVDVSVLLDVLDIAGFKSPSGLPSVPAPPTDLEQKLAPAIQAVIDAKKTGYAWSDVDALLEKQLGLPKRKSSSGEEIGGTRIKQAGGSSRAANVLKEGPGKLPDAYFIVLKEGYPASSFIDIAVRDMESNPGAYDVVAIVEELAGMWRVTSALATRPSETAEKVVDAFPLVDEIQFLSTVAAPDFVETIVPTPEALAALRDNVLAAAEAEGLDFNVTTITDAIACCLSSQFVLFAGPSGTGKSTLARLLGAFFTHPRSFSIIEARRQWIGPEDVVGYYSPLARRYLATPHTGELVTLDAGVLDEEVEGLAPPSPVLLIEEANLSPIEGYAPPLVHGLSQPSVEVITWDLYPPERRDPSQESLEDVAIDEPPRVNLWPHPRILGTINIDATSMAPARKVSGRAAVIVMEPVEAPTADLIMRSAHGLLKDREADGWIGQGVGHLQDPAVILEVSEEADLKELAQVLAKLLSEPMGPDNMDVSHRDLVRALIYMAYFIRVASDLPLATGESPPLNDEEYLVRVLAAENALLHFILPGLPAETFNAVISNLAKAELAPEADDRGTLGGMLSSRVQRLESRISVMGGLGGVVDFWTALS